MTPHILEMRHVFFLNVQIYNQMKHFIDNKALFKGKLCDSFTNYNDVGNTKVSVSIKKT